jgi:hypothetical protein
MLLKNVPEGQVRVCTRTEIISYLLSSHEIDDEQIMRYWENIKVEFRNKIENKTRTNMYKAIDYL